jgi:hypothetical protein
MRRRRKGQRNTKRQSARLINRGRTGAKSPPKRGLLYRDGTTGRFVSKSTWKRSRALGGARYKGARRYSASLNILSFDGYVPVLVHSFKKAQLASQHLNAVGRFLRTGDVELLKPFVGKRVGGVELLTDPDRLHVLADAGLVKLDGLYRQNRGRGREK